MLLSDFCSEGIAQRLVLLPIPTTRDGIYVTGTELPLEKTVSDLVPETLIAGYGIPNDIKEKAKNEDGFLFCSAVSAHPAPEQTTCPPGVDRREDKSFRGIEHAVPRYIEILHSTSGRRSALSLKSDRAGDKMNM